MQVELKWNKSIPIVAHDATGGDKTRLFMATEAKRLMQPYVPFNDGTLDKNVRTYVENDSGVVEYMSPYARFQFMGKVMVSPTTGSPWAQKAEKKVLTDKDLTYNTYRHPLATEHWDQAMLTARGDDYRDAVEGFIRKGG